MVRCLVAHPDLTSRGGAEAVCMNVLQALQTDHAVDLVTITDPDLEALNDFFDTAVGNVDVRRAPAAPRVANAVAGNRFTNLTTALFNRSVRRMEDDYDLVVSTYNEQFLAGPSVLYMHHSNYDRSTLPDAPGTDSTVYDVYDRLCWAVAGEGTLDLERCQVLANSEWTADSVERLLGVRPRVVYPPVATDPLVKRARPWREREQGFVTVGRICPTKRVLRTIDILDGVRERGHEVHLHVVGDAFDDAYARRVEAAVADRPHVHLEGAVSRERLVELLTTHRYGIHGKDNEHFGMAVAEMTAAGAVPFVPDGGGQREVVGGCGSLTYGDRAEAVDRIARVLDSPARRARARQAIPDPTGRFGRERFRRTVREVIARVTDRQTAAV